MAKYQNKTKKGFTIIEVVLVLAIGGLIMLMVFLAFPALQRSQNDSQRRNSLGELQTQLAQYQTNNRGKVPSSEAAWKRMIDDYMNLGRTKTGGLDLNTAPDGTLYTLDDIPFQDPDGEIYYLAMYCDLSNPSATTNYKAANNAGEGGASTLKIAALCGVTAADGTTTKVDEVNTSVLNWDENRHQIYAFYHARCNGENVEYVQDESNRLVAFVSKLEGTGVYCGNN